jgi:hypothetical protein
LKVEENKDIEEEEVDNEDEQEQRKQFEKLLTQQKKMKARY